MLTEKIYDFRSDEKYLDLEKPLTLFKVRKLGDIERTLQINFVTYSEKYFHREIQENTRRFANLPVKSIEFRFKLSRQNEFGIRVQRARRRTK